METFAECGIDIGFYTTRIRNEDEIFPWDFLHCGVDKSFLLREWKKANEETVSLNCRDACQACGAMKYHVGVCMQPKCGAATQNQ